jgi:hypothetical protein
LPIRAWTAEFRAIGTLGNLYAFGLELRRITKSTCWSGGECQFRPRIKHAVGLSGCVGIPDLGTRVLPVPNSLEGPDTVFDKLGIFGDSAQLRHAHRGTNIEVHGIIAGPGAWKAVGPIPIQALLLKSRPPARYNCITKGLGI